MFTGIVEEVGTVREREGARFVFEARTVLESAPPGASIAVNGCCLTAVEVGHGWWSADVVDESIKRTNLGYLAPGDKVNLERPVRVGDRLGGHLVQGHVDAVGVVERAAPDLRVKVPGQLLRYAVEKGSIAIDGCSLTLVEVGEDTLSVAIIPHTMEVTTLGSKEPGDLVNLEFDPIAKYTERLLLESGTIRGAGKG